MPILFLFTLVFCSEPGKWLTISALVPLPAFWIAEIVEWALWTLTGLQSPDWRLLLRYLIFGCSSYAAILLAFWYVPEYFAIPVDSVFGLAIAVVPAALLSLTAAQLGRPIGNEFV